MTDAKNETGHAEPLTEGSRTANGNEERSSILRDRRGAVFVEFLIAFLPVQVFFLCLIQSAILYSVRLVTEHAAVNGARAAAVVIADDRARYGGEREHDLPERGQRRNDVRAAVLLTLAPVILNGLVQSVNVIYPEANRPDGPPRTGTLRYTPMSDQSVEKVRVRVEVESACRIGFASMIVCPSLTQGISSFIVPTRTVRAEAIFPYQGANYDY